MQWRRCSSHTGITPVARPDNPARHLPAGEENQMKLAGITITAVLALGIAGAAQAQTATQTVTFQVDAINQVSVSGSPSLIINTASAGGAPTSATSAGHAWAVTTNQTGAKITASIGSAMPTGLTLSTNLSAPSGANSLG